MKNEVHPSVRIFVLAGLSMSVMFAVPLLGENGIGRPGEFMLLPGLFAFFTLSAFMRPKRWIIGLLRFLIFLLVVSNIVSVVYIFLHFKGYLEGFLNRGIITPDTFYRIIAFTTAFGINDVFSFFNYYPVYPADSLYLPYAADIVSLVVLSQIFKAYVSAYKRKMKSAEPDESAAEPAPVEDRLQNFVQDAIFAVSEAVNSGIENSGISGGSEESRDDIIERLYRKMTETDRLNTAEKTVETAISQDVKPRFSPRARAASGSRGNISAEGGVPWVLLTTVPVTEEPGVFAYKFLSGSGRKWGEGSILVQEPVNVYQGIFELNSLLSRKYRDTTAVAEEVTDPDGNQGMILYPGTV